MATKYSLAPENIAEKGTLLSICVYVFIALFKIISGHLFNSIALSADGWNNFTDVLSSVAIYAGLKLAKMPADHEHQYGHWKVESIASLMSAFIMFFVGLQVLFNTINQLLYPVEKTLDPLTVTIGITASIIMLITYIINKRTAIKINSSGLMSVAKNNLSDAIASMVTALSVLASILFNQPLIDVFMAFVIVLVIFYTGYSILKESIFVLSDGFNTSELQPFKELILSHSQVKAIQSIKARKYGANIYVDVTILMDTHLTVKESHDVTEIIETQLKDLYNVAYTDIHVEPY